MDAITVLKEVYHDIINDFDTFVKCLIIEGRDDEVLGEYYSVMQSIDIPDKFKEIYRLNYIFNKYIEFLKIGAVHEKKFIEYEYDNRDEPKKVNIRYGSLAENLVKRYAILTYKDTAYAYINGHYAYAEDFLLSQIQKELDREDEHRMLDKKRIEGAKKEVLNRIKDMTRVFSYPFLNYDGEVIFCKNGVLLLENRKLLPHGPFWLNNYVINAAYNPDAKSEFVENFINSLVPEDKRQLLYMIPATALIGKTDTSWFLLGEGSNGKSTYLTLIRNFLGTENCSSVGLQELCTNRFKVAELEGKIANIAGDLPYFTLKDTGIFKMVTGDDTITVERKFKQPFQLLNRAVFIFSANTLPQVNDDTFAFWRRWIVIEFPYTFKENQEIGRRVRNPTEEDLSYLLNKVLEAITRIKEIGIPKEAQDVREMWQRSSNPVYAFVQDMVEFDQNSFISKDEVYKAFLEYCKEFGYSTMSKEAFVKKFLSLVGGKIREERKKIGSQRVRGWAGIKLRQEENGQDYRYQEELILDFTSYMGRLHD